MKIASVIAATVIILVLAAIGQADTVIIDQFDDGASDLTVNPSSPSVSDSDSGLSNVIGGTRDVALGFDSGSGVCTLKVNDSGSDVLAYSSDTGATGSFALTYGDDLNADLIDGTNDRFRLLFTLADYSDSTVTITAYSGSDGQGSYAGSSVGTLNTPGDLRQGDPAEWKELSLSSFSVNSSEGYASSVTWTDVDKLVVYLDGVEASDYTIDVIEVTPEPATLGLLTLGGLGLLIRHRRRGGRVA